MNETDLDPMIARMMLATLATVLGAVFMWLNTKLTGRHPAAKWLTFYAGWVALIVAAVALAMVALDVLR